ncbi:alpha/beta hydrolase [Guptibacillus sedimenti]|uniref:alpha/beta hydrolase n=1 Tax=Guptibacillus sedimenti TaxID=3025680 RepID=UPI002360C04B|nr:alpha/beta hydrolase [Pseudalkalibacillus sedimenti]
MDHRKLDPQSEKLLKRIAARMNELQHPSLDSLTPEMSRYYYNEARAYFTPIPSTQICSVERRIGSHQIPIRIYQPECFHNLPVFIYMHGGGWVFGSLDSCESFCQYIAEKCRCIVVSVGYRLAPEHKYPAALMDTIDAVLWTVEHISSFGGDINKLSIGGESSGGNLAAAACIALHQKVAIHHQFLINPVTNYAFDSPSYLEDYQFNLTAEKMKWFWHHYLKSSNDGKEPFASPLQVDDEIAAKLPQALIITVEYDPLRSEGESYANKLKQNGVTVTHLHYEKLVHSFINMICEVDVAKSAVDEMLLHLKELIYDEEAKTPSMKPV